MHCARNSIVQISTACIYTSPPSRPPKLVYKSVSPPPMYGNALCSDLHHC